MTVDTTHPGLDENLSYDGRGMSVGVVISMFNSVITKPLYDGAILELTSLGVDSNHIVTAWAPGAFELPIVAQTLLIDSGCDAVICLGCVIRGETPHFDYICQAASIGIQEVALKHGRPVIFGVLTTNNIEEARERIGGKNGHKGRDAARAAVATVNSMKKLAPGERPMKRGSVSL